MSNKLLIELSHQSVTTLDSWMKLLQPGLLDSPTSKASWGESLSRTYIQTLSPFPPDVGQPNSADYNPHHKSYVLIVIGKLRLQLTSILGYIKRILSFPNKHNDSKQAFYKSQTS